MDFKEYCEIRKFKPSSGFIQMHIEYFTMWKFWIREIILTKFFKKLNTN